MLLSIDPGTVSGWALFADPDQNSGQGRLLSTGLCLDHIPQQVTRVVIERPVIYPGGRTKNPNDVLLVAVAAGEWGGLARARGIPYEYVEPARWKGQVDKDIQHARDWACMLDVEREVAIGAGRLIAPKAKALSFPCKLTTSDKRHNMLDAIGIGLFALGRAR